MFSIMAALSSLFNPVDLYSVTNLVWHYFCLYRFHGISWNLEETFVAYIAEEPPQPKPAFDDAGYRKEGSSEKDCNSWRGQGEWEENWGETYSKKGRPSLFVLEIARSLLVNLSITDP